MTSRRYRRRKLMSDINVVPYIDVMLVLLVIFMVTSPMLKLTEGVEVDLPKVEESHEQNTQQTNSPILITLTKDIVSQIYLSHFETGYDSTPMTNQSQLFAALQNIKTQYPDAPVLLKGDENALHGEVIKLLAELQHPDLLDAGINIGKVGIVVQKVEMPESAQ
jgi:biopolymer transport protein TolR